MGGFAQDISDHVSTIVRLNTSTLTRWDRWNAILQLDQEKIYFDEDNNRCNKNDTGNKNHIIMVLTMMRTTMMILTNVKVYIRLMIR